MEEELLNIVTKMNEAGESESSIAAVIQEYNRNKPATPKKPKAEKSGGLGSSSAATEPSSAFPKVSSLAEDLTKPAPRKAMGDGYVPSPELDELGDRGMDLRDKATRDLQKQYEKDGVKSYKITPEDVDKKAIEALYREKYLGKKDPESWSMADLARDKFKTSVNSLLGDIAAIPDFLNQTMFNIFADEKTMDYVNSLSPKSREVFINSSIGMSTGGFTGIAQAGVEAKHKLAELTMGIEAEMKQFDSNIHEDLLDGNYEQAGKRIAAEGVGSIPSIVQAMIPYVGIGSIMLGSAAGKNKELQEEGYDIGLKTTANAAINGAAEGLLEIVTKKIGSKLFKSLEGLDEPARKALLNSVKENLVVDPLKEGASEGATSLVQDLSDKFVQGKEVEFSDMFSNFAEASLVGTAVGGAMGATTHTIQRTKALRDDIRLNQVLKSDSNNYTHIQDAFVAEDITKGYTLDQLKLASNNSSTYYLEKNLDLAVKSGEINAEEAAVRKFELVKAKNLLAKTVGLDMNDDSRVKAVNLIQKKEVLKGEIKNMDDALALPKKEQIKKIDEELLALATTKEVPVSDSDATSDATKSKGIQDLSNKVKEIKAQDPQGYWTVDAIDPNEKGEVISVEGGNGFVTPDGDIKSIIKEPNTEEKGIAAKVIAEAVKMGGVKIDNFDGGLTKVYEENGFRVVSRTPFNEEMAPEGWNEELHGRPDVVAMVYDPTGEMNIEEKRFEDSATGYDSMIEYRDSVLAESKNPKAEPKFTTIKQDGNGNFSITDDSGNFLKKNGKIEVFNSKAKADVRLEGLQENTKSAKRTGQQNTEFFTGKAKEASSNVPYKPVLEVDQTTPVAKAYELYSAGGNFTGHISKMIAGFAEKQKQVAEAIIKGGFKSFLDIGASEGGLIKTVSSQNPNIKSVGVDPNPQMKDNFNSTPAVPNAELRQEAWQASWTEKDGTVIPEFKPTEKFDVVNEDFAFQFMNNDRDAQVAGVKAVMTPDGVFVTSEKFHTDNQEVNEKKKYDHQSKYFDKSQLTEDKQTIVNGMADDMVRDTEYFETLKKNFKHVVEFWNAGNFKGYLASDNLAKLQEFQKNVGDLSSEFTDSTSKTKGTESNTKSSSKSLYTHPITQKELRTQEELKEEIRTEKTYIEELKQSKEDKINWDNKKEKRLKIREAILKEMEAIKPTSKTKTIKTQAQETAAAIRKLKVNSTMKGAASKLNSSPLGIFTVAWDGAIETVAQSVQLTGNLAQSIVEGVEYLRDTDWYKGLSDKGQSKAERMFKEDINRAYEAEHVGTPYGDALRTSFAKVNDFIIQKFVDKFAKVRKALDESFKKGGDELNFSQAEILSHGKAADKLDRFDKELEVIKKLMHKKGITLSEMSDYMYAKHAEERNNHIKNNIDPENEFGSGMTPQEIDRILNRSHTNEKLKDLEEAAKEFRKLIGGTRELMLESGLITEETYNSFVDYYENYVPLTGFENQGIEGSSKLEGKKLDVQGSVIDRAAGRSTRADNIMANIIQQRIAATMKASKNEMLQTLYNLSITEPGNGMMKLYTQSTLPKTVKVTPEGKVVELSDNTRIREDYVGVKVEGEQFFLKFSNPEFGKVLSASNVEKTDIATRMLRSFNRYLSTTMTTLSPNFVVSNFARDIQTAIFNVMAEADINPDLGKSIAKNMVKDVPKAIKAIYGNERRGDTNTEFQKYYDEFKALGAKTGWANQMDLADIKSNLADSFKEYDAKGLSYGNAKKGLKTAFKFVEDVNTSVENGVRLSAFINARRAGMTDLQAAALAKELTVNFNKSGEYGTIANSLFLFFNAAVQGTSRFGRAMTTLKKTVRPDGTTKKSLNRAQKLAMATVVFSSTVTALNQAMSAIDDDDESFYSKIPDFEKERNLILMNPMNGKDYFKIPLPYGYNIFHNMGMVSTEVATGERTAGDALQHMVLATISSFVPISFGVNKGFWSSIAGSVVPTAVKPLVDLYSNEDYFGGQIYNENFPFGAKKPDSSMPRQNTPQVFKEVSTFLNEVSGGNEAEAGFADVSAESLNYLFKFVVGGTGTFVMNTASSVGAMVDQNNGVATEIEAKKLPFVSRVYGEHNDYVDQSTFFDRSDKLKQKVSALDMKVSSEEDKRLRSSIVSSSKYFDDTAKKLKEIRDLKRTAQSIEDPATRTDKMNKLEERYFKLIKKANKFYNNKLGNQY